MKASSLRVLAALLLALRRESRTGGGWDSYLDNLVGQSKDPSGTPHVDKAVIIGLDGGALWTTNSSPYALPLSASEAAAIARCFKGGDFTNFMNNGVVISGIKYQFLREEDSNKVFAKKKGNGCITMQASKTAIVIAHGAEGKQQGNVNKAVAVIAEYLESLGM